jgi:hypothetical protein
MFLSDLDQHSSPPPAPPFVEEQIVDISANEPAEESDTKRKSREMYIRVDPKKTTRLVIDFARRKRASSEEQEAVIEPRKKTHEEVELAPSIPLVPMSHVLSEGSSALTGFTALHEKSTATFEDRSVSENSRATAESFFNRVMNAARQFAHRSLL